MSSFLSLDTYEIKSPEYTLLETGQYHYLVLLKRTDRQVQDTVTVTAGDKTKEIKVAEQREYGTFDLLFADSNESLLFESDVYRLPQPLVRKLGLVRLTLKTESCSLNV